MSTASKLKPQPDQFGDLIDIAEIEVGDRLRALDLEKVDALAESMAQQGQLHPIVTRVRDKNEFSLVVGLHRLKAAMKLGWTQIRATAHKEMSDDQAVLAEIDENLCRAELSPAERAAHIGHRKEIYERLHPETKHGAAPSAGPGRGKKTTKGAKSASFVKATAKATGRSKRSIEADARRNKVLSRFSKRIDNTSLDKGAEMDALCELPEAEQEDLVARAEAGEKVSAKAVLKAKKNKPPAAPVTARPAQGERDIEDVKAKGGALAGETPEPTNTSASSTTKPRTRAEKIEQFNREEAQKRLGKILDEHGFINALAIVADDAHKLDDNLSDVRDTMIHILWTLEHQVQSAIRSAALWAKHLNALYAAPNADDRTVLAKLDALVADERGNENERATAKRMGDKLREQLATPKAAQ